MRAANILCTLAMVICLGCGGRQPVREDGGGAGQDEGAWSEIEAPEQFELIEDEAVVAGEAGGGRQILHRYGGAAAESKPKAKQEVITWKRSEIVPNTSRLMIGDEEELPLEGMQVQVRVDGFRARVVLDFHFLNDREQQYEGTFKLRVPNGAAPYFFAFGETRYRLPAPAEQKPIFFRLEESRDLGTSPQELMELRQETWNEPKEARMVPKDKASHAYGEIVRRRVDPALMEWSGAGIFSARVFPIAPGKMHRIVVGYDVNLLPVGDALEYRLDLPDLKKLVVDLSVATPGETETKIEPATDATRVAGRTYYHLDQPQERSVVLRLSQLGASVLTGHDPQTGDYFATRITPELPALDRADGHSRAVFMVDVSLSSNPERFEIWLDLLDAILKNNREQLQEFAVLFFNIESFWWKPAFIANTAENARELRKFADRLALEGATDLGAALREATAPAWQADNPDWDLFLLSDGANTWGESNEHALQARLASHPGRLFAYNTGLSGSDLKLLSHLTREGGGGVISVVGEAQLAAASTAHRKRPWKLVDLNLADTSDLLIAGRPQWLFPGQSLLVAGRGRLSEGAVVTLDLRRGDEQREVEVPLASAIETNLAPRIYGQLAVAQLERLEHATEEISTAYACHFRVTGRTSSLLMLETEEDYQQYNIQPEEHAFVIKNKPAAVQIEAALEQLGSLLSDPKARFLAWVEKMESMPGVEFELTTALRVALESLPSSAFAVEVPPLECEHRTWGDIPGSVQEKIAAKEISYDEANAEASRRLKQAGRADALKAVSSLVETNPRDTVLLRDIGFSAMHIGLHGQAYQLFRRVAERRPYEPQTYWGLAQCLAAIDKNDLALAYYEVALAGKWHERFGEFHRILALDYLHFLRQLKGEERQSLLAEFGRGRLQSLAAQYRFENSELLVTITWNTDNTDVDLHVHEPGGGHCYYEHPNTKIGGHLTQDVTTGYGPEMYTLPRASQGTYDVKVHYFASNRNRESARTKVYATIYRNWGRPNETVQRKVVTLRDGKEMHNVIRLSIN